MMRFFHWLITPRYRVLKLLLAVGLLLLLLWAGARTWQLIDGLLSPRSEAFRRWATGDAAEREELVTVQRESCPGAPFILPSDGFIGLLYADPRGPYSANSPHQGIDIFSNADPGVIPVYAAFDGYVRRETEWKSTVIMRVPEDPLQPGRQIWLYYTHMADAAGNDFIEETFAPGSSELFVKQGTLLGYTGNFNGDSLRDIWVHLHFSIVRDDGRGQYSNELDFNNTIDPSPYLGRALNYQCGEVNSGCTTDLSCIPAGN